MEERKTSTLKVKEVTTLIPSKLKNKDEKKCELIDLSKEKKNEENICINKADIDSITAIYEECEENKLININHVETSDDSDKKNKPDPLQRLAAEIIESQSQSSQQLKRKFTQLSQTRPIPEIQCKIE